VGRLLLLALIAGSVAPPLQAQHPAYYFFELGGPGGLASMNLEVNPVAKLRTRVGAGLFIWPSIPAMATYTFGSEANSLEVGVGATAILFPADAGDEDRELFRWGPESGTLIIATGAFGYRHRTRGGTLLRATMTPLYGDGKTFMWVGLSVGHAF
jgi:hypothetical protein